MLATQLLDEERTEIDDCLKQILEEKYSNGEFICPRCGHNECCFIATRKVYQCTKCRKQTSLTSGTRFHGMWKKNLPIAMDFIRNAESGTPKSARSVAKKHGRRYETVWRIGHKIRDGMAQSLEEYTCVLLDYHLLQNAFRKGSKESMEELVAELEAAEEQKEEDSSANPLELNLEPHRDLHNHPRALPVTLEPIVDPTTPGTDVTIVNLMADHITSIQIIYEEAPAQKTSTEVILRIALQMVYLFNETFTGISFKYAQTYVAEFSAAKLCKIGYRKLLAACVRAKPILQLTSYRSPLLLKAATL